MDSAVRKFFFANDGNGQSEQSEQSAAIFDLDFCTAGTRSFAAQLCAAGSDLSVTWCGCISGRGNCVRSFASTL